ncbi:MAG: hypothetical protein M3256_13410, partial [Actinomycetota bacterium]|nr:hypothetical protein [Actinomycetota bacterium]
MNRRRRARTRAAVAGLVVSAAISAGYGNHASALPPPPAPVSIQDVTWEAGSPGSWSAVTTRLKQAGDSRFRGELRLVPVDVPTVVRAVTTSSTAAAAAAARPTVPATPTTTLPPPSPRTAVYTAPITAEPGVVATISVLVPIGVVAYRAEVYDGAGRVVTTGPTAQPAPTPALTVGVLTDQVNRGAVLQTFAGVAGVVTSRFTGSADFPNDATALQGLDAIVVDDFDSKALTPLQVGALEDYVWSGGSIVVAGGRGGARTVAGLPEGLVPLKPTAVVESSLAPLFEIAGGQTTVTAEVVTGDLRTGRSVIGSVGGPPLLVEADQG